MIDIRFTGITNISWSVKKRFKCKMKGEYFDSDKVASQATENPLHMSNSACLLPSEGANTSIINCAESSDRGCANVSKTLFRPYSLERTKNLKLAEPQLLSMTRFRPVDV